ncbi:MAG: hypothetical protein R3C68_00255 [Myxococcota bacterium]
MPNHSCNAPSPSRIAGIFRCVFFLGGAILLLTYPKLSIATAMRMATLPELVHSADLVVTGQVLSQEARWHDTRIYTHSRVRINETWVGEQTPGTSIDVMAFGGVVGAIGQSVGGAANLQVGSQVLLYLVRGDESSFRAVAMWQGVFHIDDPATSARLRRTSAGTRIVGDRPGFPGDLITMRQAVEDILRAP